MLGFCFLYASGNLLTENKVHVKSGPAQLMQQNFIAVH